MNGTMRAWVLHRVGDLRLEEVPVPGLKPGEALIEVKSAGICSSDVPRVFTTGAYHYPIILGHEFSGVVASVRDGADAAWVGKRVGVFPLMPCFRCESCEQGRYETCSDYGYIGSRQNGAFAEYVAVPVWNLVELPENLGFEEAALFEPAAVALHAVRRLNMERVQSAAVVGPGPIGRLAAQWLGICGVHAVFVLGRADANVRVDACIEAAGRADALERCIDCARPNGQIVLVGNPDADFRLGQETYWRILRKQLTVCGVWNSGYPADWRKTVDQARGGQLDLGGLVSHRFAFDELDAALDAMRIKTNRGKTMVKFPERK